MIPDDWRRIAGLHALEDGTIAVVWLAHDKNADTVHLYDCAVFKREVLAVIAEGIGARGRRIPIAWPKEAKDVADKLLDRGLNMEPEWAPDAEAAAEMNSREIWGRMRSGRFKVEKRLAEWLDEYKSFFRQGEKIPRASHPLMAATRHAIACLDNARSLATSHGRGKNFPKLAVV